MNELKIKGRVISTPILDILYALKRELTQRGINKLDKIVDPRGGSNVLITCPYHKNGQERKPSCGVLLYGDANTVQGQVHCFTCGTTVSFTKFISDCFGILDDGQYGEQWILDNFIAVTSRELGIELSTDRKKVTQQYVSEEELAKYRFYHPYMFRRKLTEEVINAFDIGYDKSTDCITFPVKDKRGNVVFVARRSVTGKFFNYPKDCEKPVYALDKITDEHRKVVVVESFINCLTLWSWGIPAIALLGTGTSEQYKILEKTNIRELLLAFDGDEAGRKGAARMKAHLGPYKFIKVIQIPDGKDVNDLTEDEFLSLKVKE